MKKVHYPNLNFLRFLAATVVIIHHVEQFKSLHGCSSYWENDSVKLMGRLGVDLFFVLSGFLITSLLMIEKTAFKKIAVKNFIIRRIFRIWPLYFIIFFFAFFIVPHSTFLYMGAPFVPVQEHFSLNFLLYLLFLPHIQTYLIGAIAYCGQLWSIGIEEYFYFLWPFIMNKLKARKVVYFIIVFVGLYIISCLLSQRLSTGILRYNSFYSKVNVLIFEGLKFDCLFIGSFFAIFNNYLKNKRTFLTSAVFQYFIYLLELFLAIMAYQFYGFYWEVHAILYGFILMNLVRKESSIFNFEYKVFDYLGKISYGIYMYHAMVVFISVKFFCPRNLSFLVYPVVFGGTILLSAISYRYIERFFLQKKLNYSNIQTG